MPRRRIVFVCTGNVCRSPMAEHLLRQRLPPDAEWEVGSAGVSAFPGMSASRAAIDVMSERGSDLTAHRSRPVDGELVDSASVIVVMTKAHRDQLRSLFPSATEKVFLLKSFSPEGPATDVEDPIGMSPETYRRIRDELDEAMPGLVAFLMELDI